MKNKIKHTSGPYCIKDIKCADCLRILQTQPKLLEAAKYALAWIEPNEPVSEAVGLLRAAIAKAEG